MIDLVFGIAVVEVGYPGGYNIRDVRALGMGHMHVPEALRPSLEHPIRSSSRKHAVVFGYFFDHTIDVVLLGFLICPKDVRYHLDVFFFNMLRPEPFAFGHR